MTEPQRRPAVAGRPWARPSLAWWAVAAGLVVAGVLLATLRASLESAAGATNLCLFRALTGVPCPGCGLTRAFAALASFDFEAAFAWHPLAVALAAELAALWAVWGAAGAERVRAFAERHALTLAFANVVPFLAVWLGRGATGTLPF